jgi:hypothetical protein
MILRSLSPGLAGALLLVSTSVALDAQALPVMSYPTCAEQGVARVIVSVPPGRDREAFKASIERGEVFPTGTEALLLPEGYWPELINAEEMGRRSESTLNQLLARGMKVEGGAAILLRISARGVVEEVTPGTRNTDLDNVLKRLWTRARFTPMVHGGCRVVTYFHVPIAFTSEYSLSRREQGMGIGTRPAPPTPPPPPLW